MLRLARRNVIKSTTFEYMQNITNNRKIGLKTYFYDRAGLLCDFYFIYYI